MFGKQTLKTLVFCMVFSTVALKAPNWGFPGYRDVNGNLGDIGRVAERLRELRLDDDSYEHLKRGFEAKIAKMKKYLEKTESKMKSRIAERKKLEAEKGSIRPRSFREEAYSWQDRWLDRSKS